MGIRNKIRLPKKKNYHIIREWLLEHKDLTTKELAKRTVLSEEKINEWKVQCDVINIKTEPELFKIWAKYKDYSTAEVCVLLGISRDTFLYHCRKYGVTKWKKHNKQFSDYRITPPNYKKVKPQTDEEWRRLIEKHGKTAMMKMTGLRPNQIMSIKRRLGIDTSHRRHTGKRKPKEWLMEHYYDKELTLTECAKIAGVCPHTIRNWLLYYGLPTRSIRTLSL